MKFIKKHFKWILPLMTLMILAALFMLPRGYTSPIKDASGNTLPNSVASLEKVKIGGVDQWLLIRGQNKDNPVLLFLHGGPGTSEMAFVKHFNADLEKYFVVVNWDQRGAGKSFFSSSPKDSFNLEQYISDTHEVAELLKKRFHKEKIYLLGHSWGSFLGMSTIHRYPESFIAYIGTGQCSDGPESEEDGYRFVIEAAENTNNQKALKELRAIGYPENGSYEGGHSSTEVQRKWNMEFGGFVYGKRNANDILKYALFAKEYHLKDLLSYVLIEHNSIGELIDHTRFSEKIPEVKVPVYFLLGRYDHCTSSAVAEKYFQKLKAPRKELVWFEKSAHSPCFEESEKFNNVLISQVLKETDPVK
ncbi:MAG: alpha/beta hydrolase [Clostridia bacterium]|nr:alpha/beta hydrolase [Clostridia bacterium]